MASIQPRSVAFRKEREASWRELEDLLTDLQRASLASLDDQALQRLPILYREAINSLSVARATALDRALILYLEALCAQAYLAIYGSRKPFSRLLWALFVAIPNQIREVARQIWLAVFFFGLGIAVAWSLTARDPQWFHVFVAPSMASGRTPWASTEFLRRSLYEEKKKSSDILSVFSSFLFTNNARVALLAFALGFLLGIPAAIVLFYNGLVLGAFLYLFASRGLFIPLLGWLLPHGIPEIFAILLCGGAGFLLGKAILLPGRLRRSEALRKAGLRSSLIVAGSVCLLAYAALIEGFFRQLVVDDIARFTMAALQLLLLFGWFRLAMRPHHRKIAEETLET
jgi:uncharacterized membrane protein SpoIIM required for sporulation